MGSPGVVGESNSPQVPPAEITAELERILDSETFRTAKAQQNFLHYVVERALAGEAKQIKEIAIGLDVFRRGALFDPRLDNIVRVEARKLRLRLAKYYESEGSSNPVRIGLPQGGYVPAFRLAPETVGKPQAEEASSPGFFSKEVPEAISEGRLAPIEAGVNLPATRQGTGRSKLVHGVTAIRLWAFASAAILAVCAAALLGVYIEGRTQKTVAAEPSVAVLPFRNLGEIREDRSFSDGLADELIDSLGSVPGLRVVARTSAFQFSAGKGDIREIGRKLNVHMLLEGSVAKYGDRFRISAQLDDASTGYRLWSTSFDRSAKDALDVQREISLEIADDLKQSISRPKSNFAPVAFGRPASVDSEAYRDYLRGIYFWNKNTAEGLETAIGYFQKALSEDPKFARAWAGLARCYVGLPSFSALSAREATMRIREAAEKSLALDRRQGESHIYLGYAAMLVQEWPTAAKEFRTGLDREPDNAVGHRWYGNYLLTIGQPEQALLEDRLAEDLDPVSPYMMVGTARTLRILGRDQEATVLLKKALILDPTFVAAHQGLADLYLHQKRYEEALDELKIAERDPGGNPRKTATLGYAYALAGRTGEARRRLNELLSTANSDTFPARAAAQIYIGLGEKDHAFEFLSKAINIENPSLLLKVDPLYASLRSDPRFGKLLAQMNLQ